MKHCRNCMYHDAQPMSVGPQQLQMVDVCMNEECSNPVDGTPLPCAPVRNNESFCGLKGRFFKMKEEEVVEEKKQDNIIQLVQ